MCAGLCARPTPPPATAPTGRSEDEPHIERLLQAYSELLPAVNTLVGHHFTRTLINVALDHVDQVGSDAERRAIGDQAGLDMAGTATGEGPTGRPGDAGPAGAGVMNGASAGPSSPPTGRGPSRRRLPRPADGRPAHRPGEDRPGPLHVRHHRPPLRPGQPHDDLRARRPVAEAVGPGPRTAGRVPGARPGLRDRGLPRPSWRRPDWPRSAWTCRGACCGPTAPAARWPRPTGRALPVATASVDGITCGYALRNFTELQSVFDEFGRVVRPGGRISLLEVAEPDHGLLLVGHRIWFRRVVPLIGGLGLRPCRLPLPASLHGLPPGHLRAPIDADRRRILRRSTSGPSREASAS